MASGYQPTRHHHEARRGFTLVLGLLGIVGCPTRDKYDPLPVVRITSPVAVDTYTNGTVHVTAALDPPLDLPIVLRLDGNIQLATLVSPSDTFDWNTIAVTEGSHTLVAEVAFSDVKATSASKTIVVDRTAPRVISRTPAPGSTDVALRAPIQVAFSEPIILPSPLDSAFTISKGTAPAPARVTLDATNTTATISINDLTGVGLPATFSGTIMSTIRDAAGNTLSVPADAWTWSVPEFVRFPPTALPADLIATTRLPVFALGSDLIPVLASASSAASGGHITFQVSLSKYDGTRWSALGPPSDDVDSASRGVALAMAGDQPFVAWRPSVPDPGEIDVAAWSGSAWQELPPLVPAPGVFYPTVTPILRVGPDQRPLLLWSTGDRYFMARRTETGWNEDFGAIPITSLLPFDGRRFDMIVNDAGNPIVSWINPAGMGHVATWDGGAWKATPDVVGLEEPCLALDSTGNPMVVTAGAGAFLVQHLVDGNSWQLLPAAAVPPQSKHPRVAAGPSGRALLTYFDAQTAAVGMARWTGQSWDTRAYAFAPNAIEQAPQLIVDRNETAWIGWRDSAHQFNVWMSNY